VRTRVYARRNDEHRVCAPLSAMLTLMPRVSSQLMLFFTAAHGFMFYDY